MGEFVLTSAEHAARRVVLRQHPSGALRASDFDVVDQQVPAVADGEFLVRNIYVSVDPMLRLFIDAAPFGGAMPAMPPGTTIPGAAVGEIVQSRHPSFATGDLVEGRFGWQDFAVSTGAGVNRVSPHIGPIENALGVGGLPGFTAYVGLDVAGGIRPGQTVLVSGAAGAVGSMVGALVRARGGRAVGIAGGEAKRRYLIDSVGYAAVADRLAPDFATQLREMLPAGADIYFDNVGGDLLANVTPLMARGGLVLICGLMSHYQAGADASGPDHLPSVLRDVMFKGMRIQGFSQVGRDALRPAFEAELGGLIASGAIRPEMHVRDGLDALPAAMVDLFDHSVTGKVVARVAPAPNRSARSTT